MARCYGRGGYERGGYGRGGYGRGLWCQLSVPDRVFKLFRQVDVGVGAGAVAQRAWRRRPSALEARLGGDGARPASSLAVAPPSRPAPARRTCVRRMSRAA